MVLERARIRVSPQHFVTGKCIGDSKTLASRKNVNPMMLRELITDARTRIFNDLRGTRTMN